MSEMVKLTDSLHHLTNNMTNDNSKNAYKISYYSML
jgi:hypothetical protein